MSRNRRMTYYIVGRKGTSTHLWGDKLHTYKHTPDGLDAEAEWIICFPEHDNDVYDFPLFMETNYYWCREIDPWMYDESMALGYFELVSWYKFVSERVWWETAKRHMRETWEVTPSIPNVADYKVLDDIDRWNEAGRPGDRFGMRKGKFLDEFEDDLTLLCT